MMLTGLTAMLAGGAAAQGPSYDGDWDGAITAPGGVSVPLVLHLKAAGGTLDSPDQNAFGKGVFLTPTPDGVVLNLAGSDAQLTARRVGGGVLEGVWAQGGASLPARFVLRAPGAAPAGPRRPQTPKPPFPYAAEEVSLPGGAPGVTLAGTLTRPPGLERAPAVLLLAGSGPQIRDEVIMGHRIFLLLADRLTRAGFTVLRYDKRGVGGSSDGAAAATSDDYADDARAALRWLAMRKDVDAARIGLLGHSEGALVGAQAAAAAGGAAFLVLLGAPAVPGDVLLPAQIEALARAGGAPAAKVAADVALERRVLAEVRRGGPRAELEARVKAVLLDGGLGDARMPGALKEATSPWLRTFVMHDPAEDLRRLRAPVLAIYGGKDLQVPARLNAPVLRAALSAAPGSEVVELPGLNHLLQPAGSGLPAEYGTIETTMDPKALDLITRWAAKAAGLPARR